MSYAQFDVDTGRAFKKEGIEDKTENNRRLKRLEEAVESAKKTGTELPLYLKKAQSATQRSVKFIRWLHNIYNQASWQATLDSLRYIYATF